MTVNSSQQQCADVLKLKNCKKKCSNICSQQYCVSADADAEEEEDGRSTQTGAGCRGLLHATVNTIVFWLSENDDDKERGKQRHCCGCLFRFSIANHCLKYLVLISIHQIITAFQTAMFLTDDVQLLTFLLTKRWIVVWIFIKNTVSKKQTRTNHIVLTFFFKTFFIRCFFSILLTIVCIFILLCFLSFTWPSIFSLLKVFKHFLKIKYLLLFLPFSLCLKLLLFYLVLKIKLNFFTWSTLKT